ncbi:MAG: hypothetical protein GX628_00760 [Clostridiales bacterium]|nr:hypothetical protein [Clostridiales bacterium]
MRYIFDHDLHIHSYLSLCSNNPEQNKDNILKYAIDNGLKTICLTDHYWDESVPYEGLIDFYIKQDTAHIKKALPLPRADGVRFMFGCETDLAKDLTLGISRAMIDELDFIIIPTNHLHMHGFTCRGDEGVEERARLCVDRLDAVLNMDLPFHKIGMAHFTCGLIMKGRYIEVLDAISNFDLHRIFAKAALRGVGIELNFPAKMPEEHMASMLRPYLIAKEEGCLFYFGSDAHGPKELAAEKENAETIIDLLDLTEDMKFSI